MVTFLLAAALSATYTVCIDPGHVSENGSGAKGFGVNELDLVWEVSVRAAELLRESGSPTYTVVMTKGRVGESVTNRKRAVIANEAKADLMLRVHADSGGRSGYATYYPDRASKVAGKYGPNQEVIQRSRELAPVFHRAVVASLADELPDLGCMSEQKTFVGSRQGALTGSVFSEVPVFLVELCAVDNRHDAAFARSARGKEAFARALFRGVRDCLPPKAL